MTIRVGVIGVNRTRGWASTAHLPALAALPGFTTTAVASTRPEGAREVAEAFGIAHAFGDPAELIACPDVDAVAITVKAPDHAPLVRAALAAGKHVFCEWPLGVDAAEADALAALAAGAPGVHLVGLQAFHAPGALQVRELIGSGAIGEVTGVSMVLLQPGLGGAEIAPPMAYTLDPRNGVTLLTVPAAHALAALSRSVGDLVEVDGSATVRHATVSVAGAQVPNTAPNEISLVGRLGNGALATMAVHGGAPPGMQRVSFRIVGTAGALLVEIDEEGGAINVGDWIVTLVRHRGSPVRLDPPVHKAVPDGLVGPAKNIAIMYDELGRAIAGESAAQPDFAMAARFHHAIEAIARAAETGRRQPVDPYSA